MNEVMSNHRTIQRLFLFAMACMAQTVNGGSRLLLFRAVLQLFASSRVERFRLSNAAFLQMSLSEIHRFVKGSLLDLLKAAYWKQV